ncbi:hypothetical protein sos41_08060 [Alphaproteobacteria bacterium SO-S41]|nr:hypothetical protein sos41_08060 [Alphaproteobacteria bacterium SO-S41]
MQKSGRFLLSAVLASSALVAMGSNAFANGQGTPIEPAPEAPAPMPVPAAEPAPVMEEPMMTGWGGFYIGGHLGYGFTSGGDDETLLFDTNLDGTYGDTVRTGAGADAFSPGFCNGKALSNAAAGGCEEDDDGGFEGGLRLGYDWQSGSFVYGALIEGSYVNVEDSVTGFSTTPAAYQFTRELNFLGAARLRAGFLASDNFLIYATGGVAYGSIDREFLTTNTANSFTQFEDNADDGAWGYQIGGGVEAKLGGAWSIGAEYIFTSLNDDEYGVRVGPGTAPLTNPFRIVNAAGTDTIREDDKFEIHSVRAVLNYHFDGM